MSDHWDGGFAEYVKVPEKLLLKLPEDISLKLGNLSLDTIGVPYSAFNELNLNNNKTIAIFGCGPIGLSAIKLLELKGFKNIYAIDVIDNKLKLAKEFGAKYTINATKENPTKFVKEMTNKLGVDIAFDISNTVDAFRNAIYSLKKGGCLYVIAEHPSLPPDLSGIFISDTLVHRHLGIKGLMYFDIGEYPNILKVLRKEKDSFGKLITHTFPLSKIDEAFRIFFEDNDKSIRVLIAP